MEGTIISRTDRACIIRTDEGEEYYGSLDRVRDPRGFLVGAKVSFEPSKYEPPAGKKRGAIRLRLLEPGTSQSEFVPHPKRNPEDLLAKISFAFADPVLQVIVQTNRIGELVKLAVNSTPMWPEDGTNTDSDGRVEFCFPVTNDTAYCQVVADIGDKKVSGVWLRNQPPPEAEAIRQRADKIAPVHLKVKPDQVGNTMILRIISTKGSKADAPLTPTKFTVRSESGISQFCICAAGSTNWQSGSEVKLECPGQQSYQFQWITKISGENVYLRAEGNPQEFGPHYVTGYCLAPPESEHLASPATPTVH